MMSGCSLTCSRREWSMRCWRGVLCAEVQKSLKDSANRADLVAVPGTSEAAADGREAMEPAAA
jgi:hypothetical protein